MIHYFDSKHAPLTVAQWQALPVGTKYFIVVRLSGSGVGLIARTKA